MDTGLKDELKEYLRGVTEIFFSIKDTYLIAVRLTRPETDSEMEIITTDEHFNMVKFSLWKVAQMEICKLVTSGSSQHYNLIDLIKTFKPGGKYHNETITHEILKKWNDGFEELKKPILDIKTLRDKEFAHTDKDRNDYIDKIRVTINDFEQILGLTGLIIRDIKYNVFDEAYSLVTPIEEKTNLIMPRMAYALEIEKENPKVYKSLRGIKDED